MGFLAVAALLFNLPGNIFNTFILCVCLFIFAIYDSPVLFSSTHVQDARLESSEPKIVESDWVVQPMHWGLIPKWHHGDYKSFEYKMNNARSDGLLTKQSFKKPLETGQRCVVLADG